MQGYEILDDDSSMCDFNGENALYCLSGSAEC